MDQKIVNEVVCQMMTYLSNDQLVLLKNVLESIMLKNPVDSEKDDETIVESFIAAKRLGGCSERTLIFYRNTIDRIYGDIFRNIRIAIPFLR